MVEAEDPPVAGRSDTYFALRWREELMVGCLLRNLKILIGVRMKYAGAKEVSGKNSLPNGISLKGNRYAKSVAAKDSQYESKN